MIARVLAVVVASTALMLQAGEVVYSDLEHQFTTGQHQSLEATPQTHSHQVQLASHVEVLETPIAEIPPAPVAMESSTTDAPVNFAPPPPSVQIVPPSDAIVVVPEGCAELIGPCWEYNPWFAGTDLLLMTSVFSNGQLSLSDGRRSFSARPYLGYEDATGAGMRGRIWVMGHEPEILVYSTTTTTSYRTEAELSLGSFDLDLYKRFRFAHSSVALGGGVKFASFELERPSPVGQWNQEVDGDGVSAFAEVRHVTCVTPVSEWVVIFKARAAALAGQSEGWLDDELRYRVDTTILTFEAGFGTEYVRHFKHHDFVANFMAESNYWDMSDLGSAMFNGASIRLGFQW